MKDAKRCEQVRLVHEIAREYLIRPDRKISKYPVEMRDCHLKLAERCIGYLLIDDLDSALTHIGSQTLNASSQGHPLLRCSESGISFSRVGGHYGESIL